MHDSQGVGCFPVASMGGVLDVGICLLHVLINTEPAHVKAAQIVLQRKRNKAVCEDLEFDHGLVGMCLFHVLEDAKTACRDWPGQKSRLCLQALDIFLQA